jgi:hypothetical protein
VETLINPDFTYGYIQTRIMMSFPDPRYYDVTPTTVTGSSVTVVNSGWATSTPVITIASPSASGSVTNGTTTMLFANASGSGALVIDLLQRIIYLGGVPTRNIMTATSNGWLSIPPNTASATWTSTIGSMSVPYQNAYI